MVQSGMKLSEFSIVLYKGQPAIVTGFESGKIEITLESDKKKVRDKDIVPLHQGPVRNIAELLKAKAPVVDVSEAIDFFGGEHPSYFELVELLWGKIPAETAWAIWKEVSSSPVFSCTTPDEPVIVKTREEAESAAKKLEAKRLEADERLAFIARMRAALSGTGEINLPDDGKYLQDVEALALGQSDKSRTMKEAGLAETPQAAHKVLLAAGYWMPERNPWPARHGCSLFSSAVPVDKPAASADRLDLTGLSSWAIDNEWSSDPDDAVCVDGEVLWVHVADPAETVLPDSPADRDARNRGSTLYLPEGPSRMLADSALEYYALGLSPESPALSFRITFTGTGAIDTVSVHRTRVRVTRLTYSEASAKKDTPELSPLFAIAERNIARRREAGAVFIDLPEVHITASVGGNGPAEVVFTGIRPEPAADMVREMMLLAGEAAARFAFKNGIPFQYVSQESPDIPKDLPDALAGEYRKRRSMRSRKVGTTPADHAGLGIGMYSQVTSPLRRYGDLVSHQQLHLFLDGKAPMDTDEMINRIAMGDSAARECTFAERESNVHWTLVYLAAHPGWTGDAVVVERNGTTATVIVPEFAFETRMSLSGDCGLNSVIRVRAGNIQIPEQTVTFIPE